MWIRETGMIRKMTAMNPHTVSFTCSGGVAQMDRADPS